MLYISPSPLLGLLYQVGASYIVGLKANQAALLAQGVVSCPASWASRQVEKEYGRVEVRFYAGYRLNPLWVEERWEDAGLQTVVWVERERWRPKDGHLTQERVCFVSNLVINETSY